MPILQQTEQICLHCWNPDQLIPTSPESLEFEIVDLETSTCASGDGTLDDILKLRIGKFIIST